ncbi:transketolase family protein [Allorhizocola rhizosphaerae]|uniref:transketolase family protein n=1 Tax=Allorhizocola rhizosphaerae TaxID=1872709 RepID=UPI000E3EBD26|nr:transketolase [Allorhizocola rhizosphaerae]
MRETFVDETTRLLDEDPRLALVLAEISAGSFDKALAGHPERAINVGIREQLMIGVAGGLAMTGLRPIAHSYATFLVDRAYEQIKLDLGHQGVGAILVSVGASYDGSTAGYTHMSPMDVRLLQTLPDWHLRVPGHADEVRRLLREAVREDGNVYIRLSTKVNAEAHEDGEIVKRGTGPRIVAVGPMLDPVLEAVQGLDFEVVYANTAPEDETGVITVVPYLEGAHRNSIGVKRVDLHRYGSPKDHARWHGLDPASIRERILS